MRSLLRCITGDQDYGIRPIAVLQAEQARSIGFLGAGLGLVGVLNALASLRIIPLPGRRLRHVIAESQNLRTG